FRIPAHESPNFLNDLNTANIGEAVDPLQPLEGNQAPAARRQEKGQRVPRPAAVTYGRHTFTENQCHPYIVGLQIREGRDAFGYATGADPWVDLQNPRTHAIHPAQLNMTKAVAQSQSGDGAGGVIAHLPQFLRRETRGRGNEKVLEHRSGNLLHREPSV